MAKININFEKNYIFVFIILYFDTLNILLNHYYYLVKKIIINFNIHNNFLDI